MCVNTNGSCRDSKWSSGWKSKSSMQRWHLFSSELLQKRSEISALIQWHTLYLARRYSQSHLGWHFRKLKAQSYHVSFATFQWKETFELWASSFETAFENVTPSGIGCTYVTPVAGSIFRPLSQTHISKSEFKNGHISRFCSVFQVIQVISSAKFFSAEEVDLGFNSETKEHPQISNPSFWKRDRENIFLQMF